jgi:ribose 5-phosphate isomerase A
MLFFGLVNNDSFTVHLTPMTPEQQHTLKMAVAKAAIAYVPHGQVIGVGTGSTANCFIDQLVNIKDRIPAAVASSEATAARLKAIGITVVELNSVDSLGVYVDGADEIDLYGAMIKGGGAALTREKIVAAIAQKFICIVDSSKVVTHLGAFALPVEVIPMASGQVIRQFCAWGGQASLRMDPKDNSNALLTDNGNVVVDVRGLLYDDAKVWESRINAVAGVVTVGLFAARGADIALVGSVNGVETKTYGLV